MLGFINVVNLPLQNAITIATATANLFGIVITTPNKVYSLIVSGQVDQVPAAIQTGVANEVAAFQTFVQLPATIIATDVAAIAGLFGGIGAPAASTLATANAPALKTGVRTVGTPALTSFVEDSSQLEVSTAFTADLSKDPSAGEESATGTALTATNDATLPDATEDPDRTTTTASPQSGDKPADPADDTPKPGASSVSTNGTGDQATSKPNTEGGQDVSNTTNTNTFGGRHRADGTATHTTTTNTLGGRHRVRDTASGSNAGTSSASPPESDSNEE